MVTEPAQRASILDQEREAGQRTGSVVACGDLAGGVGVESDHGVDRAVAGVDATDRLLDQVDGSIAPDCTPWTSSLQHSGDATGAPPLTRRVLTTSHDTGGTRPS